MERLLLKVFCLPEQFMLCGLTLFDFHILEFYFKKKKSGDRWQRFSILRILIISLDLTNQVLFLTLFSLPLPKPTFLDNSDCFLTTGACLFLFLWDNESWSCLVAVSCQDIISSPTLKSSIMGANFFPSPPPRFNISQKGN